jgi:aryl-alcohol dehydrogenase-like predicted oxidoreductase
MQCALFPSTGWKVSRIGLGTWNIGGQWGPVEPDAAVATVQAAVDAGVNFIDTADAYGEPPGLSEERVGRALAGRRGGVYLATKVGNYARRMGHPLSYASPLHVKLCCEASLWRLRTDCIDLYQCHLGDLEQPEVFLEAFDRLIAEGKIRAFGVSTNNVHVAEAFHRTGRCAAVQLDYSLLARGAEKDLLPWCQANQVAVIVRGPLAKGLLAGRYSAESRFDDGVRERWNTGKGREEYRASLAKVEALRFLARPGRTLAQAALAFVLAHPAVTVAIPGAKSPEQARANAAAADATLAPDELARARQATG